MSEQKNSEELQDISVNPQEEGAPSFLDRVFPLKIFGIVGVSFSLLYLLLCVLAYFELLPAGFMDFDEAISGVGWLIADVIYSLVIAAFFASQTRLVKSFRIRNVRLRKGLALLGCIVFSLGLAFLVQSWIDYIFFPVYALVFLRIFIEPNEVSQIQKIEEPTTQA